MTELEATFPPALARFRRWPLSRDQVMLLMVTINLVFLSLDTYIAHHESGTLVAREWIPITFGLIAGGMLLVAGLIVSRHRPLATLMATLALLASIAVGVLGTYFHLMRAALPAAPVGERLTVDLLIWAPPVLGPLAFAIVGVLGLSAAWIERPTDSGTLVLSRRRRLHLPFSKTRAYFFTVGMGMLAALVSSVLDHARTGFESPWVCVASGALRIEIDGKILQAQPFEERGDHIKAEPIDGEDHDRECVPTQFGLETVEGRHFSYAGRAPGGPEIEQDDLALKSAEI